MSGLSAFLKSTYLLYKEATDTSLSWIAGKAKAMGYPLDNGVIGTKGIVECAQWIAEHGEQSTVSYSFAVALNYAITIRTIHGKEVSGVDLKSDERHQHFIDILRRVRKTLSSVMGPKVAQAAGIQVDPAITLSSQFAQLEVEEPSEQFLRAPDVSLPLIKNRFEIERDPLEEALFAIELILEDYKSFRTVIRECWQEYHEGTRDLIEISVMTNTAIDLARRLEADAKDLFDECGGFTTVFQKYCESSANDAPSADRVSEKQGPFNVYELAEPFLGSTFSILEDFLRSIQDGPLPDTKVAREGPGALPILPESHPFDPAIAEAKRKADEAFLHAMLLDFYVVTTKMKPILPEDELTRGLRTVYETKELSLWVIFALQVYLDINYIFHDEVARGYWDFRKYAWSIYDSINRNFGLFQSIRCDPWPYEKDEALAKIRTDLERIVDEDLVRQRKSQLGFSGAVLGSDHQYWKSHPVRCGLMAYNTRMRFQELSVEFESKWQTIYYTYFLYYALRVQNLLRAPWEDMEALIKAQPQIDLSDRAKTLQDVVAGADRRRGSKIPIVDERTQNIRLRERNPIALMFKKRFCDNDGRTNFTEEDLVNILSQAAPVKAVSVPSKRSKKNKKNKSSNDERLTIPKLLQTLRAKLVDEKSSSDFDYLEFNRLCWQVLEQVQPVCEPGLIVKDGREGHLPFMCLTILSKGFEAILDGDRSGRALFVKAGNCYAAFIRDNGSNILDAAPRRGFDPEYDSVAVFNSRFDKDGA